MTGPIPDDPEKIAEITPGQRMHDREGDELEPAGVKSYIYPVERLAPVEEAEEER